MDKSRLSLVLSIVRGFINDTANPRYDADDLTSELYLYVDGLIKSNPFIEHGSVYEKGSLYEKGMAFCRTYTKRRREPVLDAEKEARQAHKIFRESDTNKLLELWTAGKKQRQCKRWVSRIAAYLHYVEQLPIEEIAEIFNVSRSAIYNMVYAVHKPRVKHMLKKNDIVLLVMNNPFFNHMLAWVKEPTEWGAVVEVESHCFPHRKRWELRATTDEMMYIGTLATLPENPKIPESVDGSKPVLSNAQAMLKAEHVYTAEASKKIKKAYSGVVMPIDPQFTGDECNACGKMMMVRAGTCLTCLCCGTTTGC